MAPILSDYLHEIHDSSIFEAVVSAMMGIDFQEGSESKKVQPERENKLDEKEQ
jgi:hypothetical protein